MNAYFAQNQPKKYLRVVAQDKQAVDLLHNQKPKYHTKFSVGDAGLFKFVRSEKTITLLRLLGVWGELE